MSILFTPYTIKSVHLRNRIAVPPMCQYSAEGGFPNNWHFVHYSKLAVGGAGLVIVEATAISEEGRITPNCLGIWDDAQISAHQKIAKEIKNAGAVPGIQIGHAGIKASCNKPWEGDNHIEYGNKEAWETIGPSNVRLNDKKLPRVPRAMTKDDIMNCISDFKNAAKRALSAGYQWLELHFAHGYLAQSFFSTYTNHRQDEYGGSVENRARFLLDICYAVREEWPDSLPLSVRLGVIEFDGRDEEVMDESIQLVKMLKKCGLDFLNVSICFTAPNTNIPWGDGFMAPIAQRLRESANIPVASAWGFGNPEIAEEAISEEMLDIVMIGRAFLQNPNWTYYAAKTLGIENPTNVLPVQYSYWLERYV